MSFSTWLPMQDRYFLLSSTIIITMFFVHWQEKKTQRTKEEKKPTNVFGLIICIQQIKCNQQFDISYSQYIVSSSILLRRGNGMNSARSLANKYSAPRLLPTLLTTMTQVSDGFMILKIASGANSTTDSSFDQHHWRCEFKSCQRQKSSVLTLFRWTQPGIRWIWKDVKSSKARRHSG